MTAAAILGVLLVGVIVWTTPWDVTRGVGRGDPTLDFTTAEILRQQEFRSELLPWTTASWVLSVVVPLAVGFTPLGRRLVDALPVRRWWSVVPLAVVVLSLLSNLIRLPLDIVAERGLRRWGLSTQDWPSWTRDRSMGWLLSTLALIVVVMVLVALARRWRRAWWAPAALTAATLVVLTSYAYPVLVEPRFNSFTPMEPGVQRTALLELAREEGVPVRDVLVADASRRTTSVNAYVSGFGSTRRLVVYDTLLKSATPEEVRLVVAHELGHTKEKDVLHGTLIGALAAAFAVALLASLLGARVADPRRVALLLALIALGTTLAQPAQNLVSRHIEARADLHSLQFTDDPNGFVRMQHRLAVVNITGLEPERWRYWMFASHPTPPERIAMARQWGEEHGIDVPPLVQR